MYVEPALLSSVELAIYASEDYPVHQMHWEPSLDLLDAPSAQSYESHSVNAQVISEPIGKGSHQWSRSWSRTGPDKTELLNSTCSDADKAPKLSIRERNRVAAFRSRKKRNKEIKDLEEKEHQIFLKHESLSAALSDLRAELFKLENMLLAHTECDCVLIRKYFMVRRGLASPTRSTYRKFHHTAGIKTNDFRDFHAANDKDSPMTHELNSLSSTVEE